MTPYLKLRLSNRDKAAPMKAEAGTVWLYDFIAADDEEAMWMGGISPRQFMAALADTKGPVTVRVNSPGGSVFGAQAMVTAMRLHNAPITVQVDSLAASAASVIACAAESLVMSPGSMLMIHNAWSMTIGNSADHVQTAGLLDKIDAQLAAVYAEKSGADAAKFADLMAAETWFTAQEAVDAGLCDLILADNTQRAKNAWDLSVYSKAPLTVSVTSDNVLTGGDIAALMDKVADEAKPDTDDIATRQRQLAARLVANEI